MAKMSKVDAAFLILTESKKGEMSCKEIIEEALKRNIIATNGKTPEQTLRVDIKNEISRREKRQAQQRFVLHEKGVVSLVKN